MNTYESEKLKYERMHAVPGYSLGPGLSHVATFAKYIQPGESVIDFGCGTGDAARKLADMGHDVCLVDIVNALRPGHDLGGRFFEASLHMLPDDLPAADWGFCCDVMEHLPEEWIGAALAGMRKKAGKMFFAICGDPDGWGKHINETLHLTVKPSLWWAARIAEHWRIVQKLDGQGNVYLFVCGNDGR